jgi:hypothetical protein
VIAVRTGGCGATGARLDERDVPDERSSVSRADQAEDGPFDPAPAGLSNEA